MNIELMMLQVLDDPTGVRIIVETSYPDFSDHNGTQNAYFMIDRSDANFAVDSEPEIYDYWQVSDILGQSKEFNSNVELIEFLESIKGLITRAWVETF